MQGRGPSWNTNNRSKEETMSRIPAFPALLAGSMIALLASATPARAQQAAPDNSYTV
jgi:hypothetical protein